MWLNLDQTFGTEDDTRIRFENPINSKFKVVDFPTG